MKKFKKLIPAFCMLLVSAVMLGTSTFAWFSMNDTVKATNMSVTAKSETTYLMISKESDSGYNTEADFTGVTAEIKPCAYATSAVNGGSISAGKFYTAVSQDYSESNNNVISYTEVTKGSDLYMLTSTVYLKLSNDSKPITSSDGYKLKLKCDRDASSTHDSVKAIVEIDGVLYTFDEGDKEISNFEISNTTSKTVKIYVYIDGTHADVTSKNMSENPTLLKGTLGITFTLTSVSGS